MNTESSSLAHLQHGINRVVVLDIDLHHGDSHALCFMASTDSLTGAGNGTQSIIWQINEESYRKALEQAAGAPAEKPGLQVYYGSVHDILSYPCEVRTQSTAIQVPARIHAYRTASWSSSKPPLCLFTDRMGNTSRTCTCSLTPLSNSSGKSFTPARMQSCSARPERSSTRPEGPATTSSYSSGLCLRPLIPVASRLT